MKFIVKLIKRIFKLFFYSFILLNLLILIIPFLFSSSCKETKTLKEFDVIIVLGSPANSDCTPHIIMQTRVDKAVELYKKGISKHILFSGASVQNSCSEAEVMATSAEKQGIPKDIIFKDSSAQNTSENAYYSVKIMKENGFKSAAIVSSKPHLNRACLVFSKYDISFKMFGANYPQDASVFGKIAWFMGERMILSHHLIFGFPRLNESKN